MRFTSRGAPFLALALLTLAAAPRVGVAYAQQPEADGRISGRVVEEDSGVAIEGAQVLLRELGRSDVTGSDGRFALEGLPPGRYTLDVRVPRGAEVSRRVEVAAGGESAVELALATAPLELAGVTLLVDRFRLVDALEEVPGSAHVLDEEDLRFQHLLFDDAHRVLRQVPGVNVQEEDGFGLRANIGLRGTGSERSSKITVMEDGVLAAPAPYAAPAAYYFPLIGRMEAIEVRKGSSQIKYGPHTTGGALNLVSSAIPADLEASGLLEGGAHETGKLHAKAGATHRNFGWLVETYQLRTDGFKELDGGGDTGFDLADYLVKLRLNTDGEAPTYQELELKLGLTDEVSDETYLGLTESDFRSDPFRRYAGSQEDVMDADHRTVQLRHVVRPSARVDVTTVLYRNDFSRSWYKLNDVNGKSLSSILEDPPAAAVSSPAAASASDTGGGGGGAAFPAELAILRGATSEPGALRVRNNNRDYYAQGVQTVLGFQLSRDGILQELELGARYHRDQEDRLQEDDAYRMIDGRMVLTAEGAPGSQDNRVGDAEAWAFFVQDRITLGRWTVTPGLRFEDIAFTRMDFAKDDPGRSRGATDVREHGVSALIPGLGATLELDSGLSLFGGVHRGFGPPGPSADEETEPEESVNYELGARLARGALSAQAVAFLNDYENILGAATLSSGDAGTGDLFNGGEVDVHGLELSVDADVARAVGVGPGLPVRLAYTYTQAEFASSFESEFDPWGTVSAGDDLPYLPEHQLFASAGVARDGWGVSLTANAVGETRTVAGRGPIPEGEGTDGYLVFGLAGELALAPWSRLVAGVQNLPDEEYVVSRRPAGARPGLPRTLVGGLRFTF
ncbi:MAG: TonB-dependent receptor domain-containing protein [Gemmatimonadota bacterium]